MKKLFGYIRLGRLNKRIADKINKPTADIYIEYNHLRHIEKKRGEYLKSIKLNALSYVKKIVDNYSEIWQGKSGELLLVAYIKENDNINMTAIELQLLIKTECYLVKTAFSKRYMAKNEVLLWQK